MTTYEPAPGLVELVAYYSPVPGCGGRPRGVHAPLRTGLPAHMVPAYLEELASIPTMTSGKADRKASRRPGDAAAAPRPRRYVAPADRVETVLAEALAEIIGLRPGLGGRATSSTTWAPTR